MSEKITRCEIHPLKKNVTKRFSFSFPNASPHGFDMIEFSVCDFCFNELESSKRCHADVLKFIKERIAERVQLKESPIKCDCKNIFYNGTTKGEE